MLNKDQKRALIQAFRDDLSAEIFESDVISPFRVQVYTLDLSTAQSRDVPFQIGFPFKSVAVKNATGGVCSLYMKFDDNQSGISWTPLNNNDVFRTNRMFSSGYLYWPAQSGVSVTLIVFTDIEYTSGALINSGTINVTVPSTKTITRVNVAATTATQILTANSNRKRAKIQNNTIDLVAYGSSSSVTTASGANMGFCNQADETYTHDNQSGLWIYSNSGGDIIVEEET